MTTLTCPAQSVCSGCDFLGTPLADQITRKTNDLSHLLAAQSVVFPAIEFLSPGLGGLRDRLDFTFENGRVGLWKRRLGSPEEARNSRETAENASASVDPWPTVRISEEVGANENSFRELVDLAVCPQLSPRLHDWYLEFRKNLPPVQKGSVRLRIAPDGTRGMWLDMANVDIKALLDEGDWLRSWPQDVRIEMGQRRKFVQRETSITDHASSSASLNRPALIDPVLFPWFETRWGDQTIPLFGTVGGFTQPSLHANRWISDWIQEAVLRLNPERITEFGTGQGNLSFPALSGSAALTACEFDRPALAGFERSLEWCEEKGFDLRSRVQLEAGDFLRKSSESLRSADLLIANPPRSGLKAFLDPLAQAQNLHSVLYMSCHPESFAEDAPRLIAQGFELTKLKILDQFPQTKHYEVLSEWSRATP